MDTGLTYSFLLLIIEFKELKDSRCSSFLEIVVGGLECLFKQIWHGYPVPVLLLTLTTGKAQRTATSY
ncbi:MAG: hypothetical protein JST32_03020 [Bacteroidetes bacterium]|nr:hypothetical protein [Bacteroidota bacterium]